MSVFLHGRARKANDRLMDESRDRPIQNAIFRFPGDIDAQSASPLFGDNVDDAMAQDEVIADIDAVQPLDLGIGIARIYISGGQGNFMPQSTVAAGLESPAEINHHHGRDD